jgi:hypothetical protein
VYVRQTRVSGIAALEGVVARAVERLDADRAVGHADRTEGRSVSQRTLGEALGVIERIREPSGVAMRSVVP